MTWTDKLIGDEEERAVSPVIGVILMVAITVILAAVIAAFVMDIGPGGESVTAGASVSEAGDTVTVQVNDMGNADGVIITNGDGEPISGFESSSDIITSTGVSKDYDIGNDEDYIVYAFTGDTSSNLGTSSALEDQVEAVMVLDEGTTPS